MSATGHLSALVARVSNMHVWLSLWLGLLALVLSLLYLWGRARSEPPDMAGSIHQMQKQPGGLVQGQIGWAVAIGFVYVVVLKMVTSRFSDLVSTAVGALIALVALGFLRASVPQTKH